MSEEPNRPVVIPFPKARARPGARNLGLTPLSQALGRGAAGAKGHWCDRCQGVWYSHFGEARCPVCGEKG